MADITTVARPYAKAAFEYALASKQLAHWSAMLGVSAQIAQTPMVCEFISNPLSTIKQQTELFISVIQTLLPKQDKQIAEHMISLLAMNKRLLVLPDMFTQFEVLRASYEKTLTVSVESFSALTKKQEEALVSRLSARLQRAVKLDVSINKSLLGGAVISAGDFVLDGSVRSKIDKLGTNLAA